MTDINLLILLIGVVPMDLLAWIRLMVLGGCFSIDSYNEALLNIGYLSYERGDVPCPVPTTGKVQKLRGKAIRAVHDDWTVII